MNVKLDPLSIENAASVDAVRLLDGARPQLIYGSGGELHVHGSNVVAQANGLPGSIWDAAVAASVSRLVSLFTKPGSAVCWVASQVAGAEESTRLHGDAFVVYGQPHFVRRGGMQASAIRYKDGKAQLVLFPDALRVSNPKAIGEPLRSLTDARLVQDSEGFWLLGLTGQPAGGLGSRATASGTRAPGALFAQRLGKDLKPVGDRVPILGNHPVFEFDADAAPGNGFALFATTPAGAVFAQGTAEIKGPLVKDTDWKETAFQQALSSPAILSQAGAIHVAALENRMSDQARILMGRIE